MATGENNNPNHDRTLDQDKGQNPQSQNNNGNIGREAGTKKEGEGSLSNIAEDNDKEKPANEEGVGENQENHWSGNHGQKSSNRPGSRDRDSFNDQNLTNAVQQNEGRNHVTNAGGTSQEDLEKDKTGLRDNEDQE